MESTNYSFKPVFPGTFSPSKGLDSCLPCSTCPSGVPMLASCSATQDTQCECDVGFYFLRGFGLCAPCSRCRPGHGVVRECRPQGDTLCQKCGPGTFSEEDLNIKPCQACSQCSDEEVEIQSCMHNFDTLCMGECFYTNRLSLLKHKSNLFDIFANSS